LHGQDLVLNAVPAASVMVSLSESVTAMPFLHFLEDEFGEVEKILLCQDAQNSSVCVHQQHRIHQYVFISNMWHEMLEGDVTFNSASMKPLKTRLLSFGTRPFVSCGPRAA